MKPFLLICAALLFLAMLDLPIGYYTFLRIVVTIGAVVVVGSEYKEGIGAWVILFGLVAVLFNPLIPVYLHDKAVWMPIDLVCGILFLVKAFALNPINENNNS